MKSKRSKQSLSINWKKLLAAISASFFLSFSIYILFLEPSHVISRLRLVLAGFIWGALFLAILIVLGFDFFKLGKLQPRMLVMGTIISLGFSTAVLAGGFGITNMPYNLLLLHKHDVIIQAQCPNGSGVVELNTFKDGLDVVSYAAFEKQGNWDRTNDSLRTTDCSQARLTYNGWLVEKPVLAFRTQPGGGTVSIQWDGNTVKQDLSAISIGQVEISQDLGPDMFNKGVSFSIFLLALTILLFPLGCQFSAEIIDPPNHHRLKDWFEETGANLRPLVLGLLALSLIATIGLSLTPWLEQDHTTVQAANPTVQEKPNIILIIADSMSAQDMSLFGHFLPTTPNLERETKDWTIYTNANTAATCTIGIFPALNSGRYPIYSYPFSQYGEQISADPNWVNLMAMMAQSGYNTYWNNYYIPPNIYHTAQGIDHFLFFPINNPLFRTWYQAKSLRFSNFPHFPLILQLAAPLFQQSSSNDSPRILGEMLTGKMIDSPFFIYIHYRGPHFGSYYAGKYLGTFLPKSEGMTGYYEQNELLGPYPPDKQSLVNKLRLRYDEAILHDDDEISQLIEQIKTAGIYDSTMIIVTADHGQVFDNGFVAHCTPLISYNETHIPILIKFPHQSQGRRIESLTSLIDLTPTILDVANLHYEKTWFDGISLLDSPEKFNARQFLFVRNLNDQNDIKTPSFAVMNDQYKLVQRKDGYYLFDYRKDPSEKNNLINNSSFNQDLLAAMKTALADYIRKTD